MGITESVNLRHAAPHPIKRALLSVSDKEGLLEFATALRALGIEIVSTGGTAKSLQQAGVDVTEVAETTRFPEILDGRVKTLHPAIHAGILAKRGDALHQQALEKHKISMIDLVVVNLYPFAATYQSGQSWPACVEQIDVGGPAMIRAAAKNYNDVTVVTSPTQYQEVLDALAQNSGGTDFFLRKRLAQEAFQHTAQYDAMIAEAFAKRLNDTLPKTYFAAGTRTEILRYGENPHQEAALYRTDSKAFGVVNATQLQGKELSYNNINDTDAAFELVAEFTDPAVVIVKHANPCGVAVAKNLTDAYRKALACDPTSAFGGIVAVNRELDKTLANELSQIFLEVIIAPSVSHEAQIILSAKKNVRVLVTNGMPDATQKSLVMKPVAGGFLLQTRDALLFNETDLKVVTKRQPDSREMEDLLFAFQVAKYVKSNAIVYAKSHATVGIGAGQMSRVDAARIAVQKAQDIAHNAGVDVSPIKGAVVASDAFFPFADGLLTAMAAGVTAVIQPGGSIRDAEVIAAADAHGAAMVFTGVRHFRH